MMVDDTLSWIIFAHMRGRFGEDFRVWTKEE